jgi:hypothetical protein
MPPEMLNSLPGYDRDVQKNRAEARQIMKTLGYSPDNHLKIKVTVRDIPYYRDPGVILIDQLQQVYIDGELEPVDTTNFFPKMMRKDYSVGLNLQGAGDPDQTLPLLYGCGSEFNRNNYCNPEVEKLIDRQSSEVDQEKRKQLVWQIDRKGRCSTDHLLQPRWDVSAAARKGADPDGQQHLQRMAHGRRLARQVAAFGPFGAGFPLGRMAWSSRRPSARDRSQDGRLHCSR